MARNMNISGPTLSAPVWAGEALGPGQLIPGGAKVDAAQFLATDAVVVTMGANASIGATSLTVAALTGPIPSGTVLDFGTNKFARLTAAAAAGATTLAVAAIPTALTNATDSATYPGVGRKSIPSGTPIGRTIAERDANTPYGPAINTDDEIYLVAFDIYDATQINDVELVRNNVVVKENFLPNWTNVGGTLKTAIRSRYRCILGVA